MTKSAATYQNLTPKAIIELAAPHTWPAAVIPVLLAAVLALHFKQVFDIGRVVSVLLTAIFLQAAVNTINDYSDFVSGTDTRENSDDETDASIVYNNINPRHALLVGLGFIGIALLSGLYAIFCAGPVTLIFGGLGTAILLLYSLGAMPISYLPLGELVSGFTMGGLITMGGFFVFTGEIRFTALLFALPLIVTIALIMMANNISDIERDRSSGRKTFPVLAGRRRSAAVLKACVLLDTAAVIAVCALCFRGGLPVACLMPAALLPPAVRLWRSPLGPSERMHTMRDILALHRGIGLSYVLLILANFLGRWT